MMTKALNFYDLCIWVSLKFDDESSLIFDRLGKPYSSPILDLSLAKQISVIGMTLPTYDFPRFLYDFPYLKKMYGTCLEFVPVTFSSFMQKDHSIIYGIKPNSIDDFGKKNFGLIQEDFPYGVASFLDPSSATLGFIMSMRYQKLLPYLQAFFESDMPLCLYIHGKSIYLYHLDTK